MYTERRFQHFRSHAHAATVATERKNGNGMVETRHMPILAWWCRPSGKGVGLVINRLQVQLCECHTATGCHLQKGSHSVTFHPTQVNTPPDRLVLDLPTPEGWKAELT